MNNSQITIKDIARQLGVSTSTVSRALRGLPDVNPKTRKMVIALAEKLDYQPNTTALSLVKKKTNIIGVIIPDLMTHFFSAAVTGIHEVASRAGYNVMIAQSNESLINEINNVNTLVNSRADGLIIAHSVDTTSSHHFQSLINKGIPLIFFDRVWENLEVSQVIIDDFEISRIVVDHLVKNGYSRIGFIAGPDSLNISKNRLNGFTESIRSKNMVPDEEIILRTNLKEKEVVEATKRLISLPNPPDVIFCLNDLVATYVINTIRNFGLRIPDDIAIIGCGDEPVSTLVRPQLSSVLQYPAEQGRLAAKMFLEQIEDEDAESFVPRKTVLKPKLIPRESTRAKTLVLK
jgi:DNA-binding LacI/PurR family transcriptional regulator